LRIGEGSQRNPILNEAVRVPELLEEDRALLFAYLVGVCAAIRGVLFTLESMLLFVHLWRAL